MPDYYALSAEEVIRSLNSSKNGLLSLESKERLIKHSFNEIPKEKHTNALKILFDQFNNVLSIILIIASAVSLFVGDTIEAIAMFSIVIINAILGFTQEYKAEKALEALEEMSTPSAKVLRNNKVCDIAARELVPGDVILLEEGDIVPADSRLFEVASLNIDESMLTGESVPSAKVIDPFKQGTMIADQENMAFCGTIVTHGRARAVVTATGLETEFGKIAKSIQGTKEQPTVLQIKFNQMSAQIGIIALILILIVFAAGLLSSKLTFTQILLLSMALAVATIPVALPTIVTIGLSMGSNRLSKKNMLIKKLAAAESLGAATVICSDKTGTITKNEMTVVKIFFNGKTIDVTGIGYNPQGEFLQDGRKSVEDMSILMNIAYLCNNTRLVEEEEKFKISGDPTEGSLVVMARKFGIDERIKNEIKVIKEFPFDSERKRMSIVVSQNGKTFAYVKGAPDILLSKCTKALESGTENNISESQRKNIGSMNYDLAENALRVLGFAYKEIFGNDYSIENIESNLVFAGLVGMIDPPREGVKEAVSKCKDAGIKVMMITGDHPITARAIAQQVGIYEKDNIILTGKDLEILSDQELDKKIEDVRIIARALPIEKSRIVDSLKRKGHVVVMTGDGVNDAPALKKSDIGVSMGISGTSVAKEVSKAILIDDNFTTIVNAVSEGRNIYDKIIKSAKYLLSCNSGEILTILTAILINLPLPLLPLQILLVNLLTDALPAAGLGMEKEEEDIMKRMPRNPSEKPLTSAMILSIVIFGIVMALGTLFMFNRYFIQGIEKAQTVAFTTLVMFQLFAVFSSRSLKFSFSAYNPFTNPVLMISILASFSIQMLVISWTPLQKIFGTVDLTGYDLLLITGVSMLGFIIMEAVKLIIDYNSNNSRAART